MKPAYGLELQEAQKLALTPEVRQAIMVLQMSALELTSFIRQQVEENPLLEMVFDPHEESLPESSDPQDEELLACFCDSSDLGPSMSSRTRENPVPLYEVFAEDRPGLREYLSAQLGLLNLSPEEHLTGELLIGNIDDNGYLRSSPEEISRVTRLPLEKVEGVLAAVQSLDPPGVGARDLRECLLLQARAARCDAVVIGVIDGHLGDLAAGRYRKIAKEMGTSVQEVMKARDDLLTLDPKPGARYSSESVKYVYPEITVRREASGITVTVLDSALPRVRWNPFYRRLLEAGDKDARTYLQEQLRKARSLLRSIEQRRETIVRVMECVASRQAAFFREGPAHLEPLTMKDVAQQLGLHESTVSRCLRDKYVDTPYGVFPCKSFFSPKVRTDDRDVSQYMVKRLIQTMIQAEDPGRPLADQEISAELSKRGMHVARRTVAKYRSQLGIKPSGRRKVL
ncbi:MAG: RNA polymerase factor sigma-54 [Bacillota bacterium]